MIADKKVQRLRNELGQLTHKVHGLIEQRREMQADLIRQRDDMRGALVAIEGGSIQEAKRILAYGLAVRDHSRTPRRSAQGGSANAA